MQAVIQDAYGSPEVLSLVQVRSPSAAPGQVLIQVHASVVSQGDRRLRSSDFPGISWLPGRLMMGLLRPRNRIPGTMFAGRVVALGDGVTRFQVGDDVFGSADAGAHAQRIVVNAAGPIAAMPQGWSFERAASLPYGGVTALVFLDELAELKAQDRVLILGASGGVGRYLVQLAKHRGAHVTGVASQANQALVRSLGADQTLDYRQQDFATLGQRYDVIIDTIGVSSFSQSRPVLSATGVYLSLIINLPLVLQTLLSSLRRGQRAMLGVAIGTQAHMESLRALAQEGVMQPLIERTFELSQIQAAHAHLESPRSPGAVVVSVPA